jgi:mannose-6-phosphate isomerase-like protein (cupin superfamily)
MEGDDNNRRELPGPLDTSDLAINYYALALGETLLNGLHIHLDQGEAFYILEGTATFETKSDVTADSEIIKM